jgi:hypothetical protein
MRSFKKQQIEISQRLEDLTDDMKILVSDLLVSLTDEQKQSLSGYNINETYSIEQVDEDVIVVTDGENSFNFSLDDMNLIENKGLVDHIMLNILNN